MPGGQPGVPARGQPALAELPGGAHGGRRDDVDLPPPDRGPAVAGTGGEIRALDRRGPRVSASAEWPILPGIPARPRREIARMSGLFDDAGDGRVEWSMRWEGDFVVFTEKKDGKVMEHRMPRATWLEQVRE